MRGRSVSKALTLSVAITLPFLVRESGAQPYPARPMRMIIPYSAGGATDVPGRILAQKLAEALSQPVVVDNRPGAGSLIGTELVAKAAPDGYTVLMTASPFAISAALYKKLPYDPVNDFAAVTQFGSSTNVVVVHPTLPVKSVPELIALARSQPGKLDYASSGSGGAQHLFGALFMSMAALQVTHVAYKGSGPATADLLSGQVKIGFPGIVIALQHHKAGRLRALAVTRATRSPQMPEIPTVAEAGVPAYDAAVWLGVLVPRATPAAAVQRLQAEIAKLMQAGDVRDAFVRIGTDPIATSPAELAALLKVELEKWRKVIHEIGA